MRVAFGIKAHSGWAVLIALGVHEGDLRLVDRRRVDLIENDQETWAKQPYHAALGLSRSDARGLVRRSVQSARRLAVREMRGAVKHARDLGHEVVGCGVLVGDPMPAWTVEEILAVHFRMHKAEGDLFREALVRAAGTCGLKRVAIPEKLLEEQATKTLATPVNRLRTSILALGKSAGPQKSHTACTRLENSGQPPFPSSSFT